MPETSQPSAKSPRRSSARKAEPFRALLERAFSDEGVELPPVLTDLPPMSARLLADLDGAPDVDITDPGLPVLPSLPSLPPRLAVDDARDAALDAADLDDLPTAPLPVILPAPPTVRLKAAKTADRVVGPSTSGKKKAAPPPAPVVASAAAAGKAKKKAAPPPAPVVAASPFDLVADLDVEALEPRTTPPKGVAQQALPVARGEPTAAYQLKVRRGRPDEDAGGGATRVDRKRRERQPAPFELPLSEIEAALPPRAGSLDLIVDVLPPVDATSSLPRPAPKPVTSREGVANAKAQRKANELYVAALEDMGRGEHQAALVHLKLAVAYDPTSTTYKELTAQIERKLAKRKPPPEPQLPTTMGEEPALLVLSRDGTKRGAPTAYWTRKR